MSIKISAVYVSQISLAIAHRAILSFISLDEMVYINFMHLFSKLIIILFILTKSECDIPLLTLFEFFYPAYSFLTCVPFDIFMCMAKVFSNVNILRADRGALKYCILNSSIY